MTGGNPGCFSWCISFKKACNERWARFRNNFRRRFYTRRGLDLDLATVLNESGTKDMHVLKQKYKSNKVLLINVDPEVPAPTDSEPQEATDEDFERQVEEYVLRVIRLAADNLSAERQLLLNNAKVTADDTMSMTSSVISQLAGTALTESLTNIMMDSNQSARRPRTMKEFFETFRIASEDSATDDMPSVNV